MGRKLQFRDDTWQQLSGYGFNDKASSWKNRLNRDACLSWDLGLPARNELCYPLAASPKTWGHGTTKRVESRLDGAEKHPIRRKAIKIT
jgi:hypothetical protein